MNKLESILLVGAVSVLLYGCSGSGEGQVDTTTPVKVTLVRAVSESSFVSERIPGSVRPALESQLEAKISGKILRMFAKEGDRVTMGQVLAEIDSREVQARLEQALAAQAQAVQDAERFAKLLPAGAVTRQELEASEARKKIATAAASEAQAMVSYTKITSPYNGTITKKLLQEGDFASPGKPLFFMEQQLLFRFEADLPETLSGAVELGQSLKVTLSGMAQPISARVSELSPVIDQNTRTFKVKLDLPDNTGRSGQFGYVDVPGAGEISIKVPKSIIRISGQLEFVYVAEGDRVHLRLVRSGRSIDGAIEILSGVSEGELLVLTAEGRLTDGAQIEVLK